MIQAHYDLPYWEYKRHLVNMEVYCNHCLNPIGYWALSFLCALEKSLNSPSFLKFAIFELQTVLLRERICIIQL